MTFNPDDPKEHSRKPSIDSMPAGREMDALVAEKVMGLHVGIPSYSKSREPHLYFGRGRSGSGYRLLPCYSSKIQDAWKVVENLRARKFGLMMDYYGEKPEGPVACATFYPDGTEASQSNGHSDCGNGSMPLAICRAALKAVGLDNPPSKG